MSSGEFDWYEYLTLSQSLIQHITREAAYWEATLLRKANLVTFPHKNMHKYVWEALGLTWTSDGISIGKLGDDMKSLRVWADYKSFPRMTKNDADKAVIMAEELIDCLRQISSGQLTAVKTRADQMLKSLEYI